MVEQVVVGDWRSGGLRTLLDFFGVEVGMHYDREPLLGVCASNWEALGEQGVVATSGVNLEVRDLGKRIGKSQISRPSVSSITFSCSGRDEQQSPIIQAYFYFF